MEGIDINQGMTVPLLLLVAGVISWCAWLTKRMNETEKEVAVNSANDKNVTKQIDELKKDIKEDFTKLETHFNTQFKEVTGQFSHMNLRIDQLFNGISELSRK